MLGRCTSKYRCFNIFNIVVLFCIINFCIYRFLAVPKTNIAHAVSPNTDPNTNFARDATGPKGDGDTAVPSSFTYNKNSNSHDKGSSSRTNSSSSNNTSLPSSPRLGYDVPKTNNGQREQREREQREREQREREQRERERRDRELKEKQQRDREDSERAQRENEEKENREREREEREKEQREKGEREREQREREQKERDQREREQREREQKEREQKEREQREREQREREQREREQREKEQREKEQREKEQREKEQKEREDREKEQREKEERERDQRGNENKQASTPDGENNDNGELPTCPLVPPHLNGPLATYTHPVPFKKIAEDNPGLQPGGRFKPPGCISRHRVAIVIPYRNREEHLQILLNNLHPMLMRQQLDYGIFVIDQALPTRFNRAMLMNVGYAEAMKRYNYQCAIFHDVDLLPENDRNIYSCPEMPRHLSAAIDKFRYRLPYAGIYGGVSAVKKEQFEKMNGFSNMYFGWGGEDDDMARRIRANGLKITRYSMDVARYRMIKHTKDKGNESNPQRFNLLRTVTERMKRDGLNSLKYTVQEVDEQPTHLRIQVFIDQDEIMKVGLGS